MREILLLFIRRMLKAPPLKSSGLNFLVFLRPKFKNPRFVIFGAICINGSLNINGRLYLVDKI